MGTGIPSFLENAVGFNIYRVSLLIRRELMKALEEYDITPEQWQVLVSLWEEQRPMNQQEISRITLRDKHTVSRMLARMERDGWVARQSSAEDRRSQEVTLTPKAWQNREAMVSRLLGHFEPILGCLEKPEQDVLLGLLQRLRSQME
ncbi:MAG: MarR family transcriptional regulator [Deltaproteobacteria bacterium]|nr:MarR family transcriptional regulator [Deltaproteobacteria bacterium]